MPLVSATLANALESLFDEPPLPVTSCAGPWADGMEAYAAAVVPPSTTVGTAAVAFESALATMDQADQAQTVIQTALTAFATAVALGMQPAFTGVPPASSWSYSFSNTISASEAAQGIASSIDTWMKTGTATNNVLGISTTWS